MRVCHRSARSEEIPPPAVTEIKDFKITEMVIDPAGPGTVSIIGTATIDVPTAQPSSEDLVANLERQQYISFNSGSYTFVPANEPRLQRIEPREGDVFRSRVEMIDIGGVLITQRYLLENVPSGVRERLMRPNRPIIAAGELFRYTGPTVNPGGIGLMHMEWEGGMVRPHQYTIAESDLNMANWVREAPRENRPPQ